MRNEKQDYKNKSIKKLSKLIVFLILIMGFMIIYGCAKKEEQYVLVSRNYKDIQEYGIVEYEHTFDEKGNILSIITDDISETKWEYEYDKHGNPISAIVIYSEDNDESIHEYSYNNKYDSNGLLLSREFDSWYGAWVTQTYDEYGNIEYECYDYTYNGTVDSSLQKTIYHYDQHGNIIKVLYIYEDGNNMECIYTYDEENNMIKSEKYYGDESEIIEYEIQCSYDDQGRVDESVSEGTNGTRRIITYEYNEDIDYVKNEIVWRDGGIVSEYTYKYVRIM